MKDQLTSYFLANKGKYLVLENGKRVKLTQVEVDRGSIDLLFLYNNEYITINFYTGRKDQIRMNIPKGLHYTNVVVFESLDGIGILLDRILCNWVEQERETIKGLNWEERWIVINFWKLTYKSVKEQRDELKLQNMGLKKELNYRNKSYTELFEAYEKLEREIEDINKHEDGLVSTIKLKDELLKESGEKIAELERENEKLKRENEKLK